MPARVTLIITTFLTITFILQSISAQTAKATTTTSLQIFLIFSVVLVVVAILELILVLYFDSLEQDEVRPFNLLTVIPRHCWHLRKRIFDIHPILKSGGGVGC